MGNVLPRLLILVTLVGLALLAPTAMAPSLEQRLCLIIFAAAAGLWVTELIPPFATAILVIASCVFVLGSPSFAPPGADAPTNWTVYVSPLSSPVLMLFFGGFILARAANKHAFDIRLAAILLRPCGARPSAVLFGVIVITAVFSMFMSNTATTAMMVATLGPLIRRRDAADPLRKALLLAIPFAANIGGMATLIGTPPNAVAASVLGGLDPSMRISFVKWMMFGTPIVAVILLALWAVLAWRVRGAAGAAIVIERPPPQDNRGPFMITVLTFAATVGLWLTEPLTGVPAPVAAMLPIAVLFATSVLDREDLRQLDWDTLILVTGGLTLGLAVTRTGLAQTLVSAAGVESLSPLLLGAALATTCVVMSNFMSNTAAANVLIPIATSLTAFSPKIGAILVALCCSLAMSLPVSTPPNAIAYAAGGVSTRDLLRYGTLVTAIGLLVVGIALFVLPGLGIL